MHLTIRRYRKIEGDKQQIIELVNREFVPLISKIDGFNDFYAVFSDDGTLTSVSVFRDARGAEESRRWRIEEILGVRPGSLEAPRRGVRKR